MNTKASFTLKGYIVAFVLFGAVIGLYAIGVSSVAVEYDAPGIVDSEFQEKYSQFTEYTERIESARISLSDPGGIQLVNIGFGVFQASFAFIELIISSFGLIDEPTKSFTEDFNVPFQIAALIFIAFTSIIVINLITRIYSSVTQGRF